MNMSKIVMTALSLLLLVATAQDVFAQRRWRAKEEVEAGGWQAAYGNELTEDDATRGAVESWVSLQTSDRETIRTWADQLLRQSISLLVSSAGPEWADNFGRDEQREARRFSVETIRDLLGSRTAGAQILVSGPVEVKAGVIEYRDRRVHEIMFMPYIALRLKYGRNHRHHDRDGWRSGERDYGRSRHDDRDYDNSGEYGR